MSLYTLTTNKTGLQNYQIKIPWISKPWYLCIRLEYAPKVKYFQTLSNCISNGSKNIHKCSAFHFSFLDFVGLNYFNKITFRRKFWFSLHSKNSNGSFFKLTLNWSFFHKNLFLWFFPISLGTIFSRHK